MYLPSLNLKICIGEGVIFLLISLLQLQLVFRLFIIIIFICLISLLEIYPNRASHVQHIKVQKEIYL